MIGKKLTQKLLANNHQVVVLSRRKGANNAAPVAGMSYSKWEPSSGEMDFDVIENADAVVNLAGDTINQRWSKANKKSIVDSRVSSTSTLVEAIKSAQNKPEIFISASAIGYYPSSDEWKSEEDPPGDGFLSETCKTWEAATNPLNETPIRKVIFRIGMVLAQEGGALPVMKKPVKWGLGAPLGTGKQYQSFIHIDDLTEAFYHALLKEQVVGTYNAVAPQPTTNAEMTKLIAQLLGRPFFLPRVPELFLKMVLGEMAAVVITSNRCSAKKLASTGFSFSYPDIRSALDNLIHTRKTLNNNNINSKTDKLKT